MQVRVAFFGQSGPYSAAGLAAMVARFGAAARLALIVEAPGHKRRVQHGWRWGWGQPQAALRRVGPELDLEVLSRSMGVAHVWANDGDDSAVQRALAKAGIDVGATVGFPFLLSARTRAAAITVYNAHPSALPRWRGPSPLFWWLRSGEEQTAVTVHEMDAHFDRGPIVATAPFAPPLLASGAELYRLAGSVGGCLLARVLTLHVQRRLVLTAQRGAPAQVAPRPRPHDGHVVPGAWSARGLARFFAGARHFVVPSFVLADKRYFVAHGDDAVGLPDVGVLPGEFAQVGETMWLRARDGLVTCRVQREEDEDLIGGPRRTPRHGGVLTSTMAGSLLGRRRRHREAGPT